jgi:hypothetical protein
VLFSCAYRTLVCVFASGFGINKQVCVAGQPGLQACFTGTLKSCHVAMLPHSLAPSSPVSVSVSLPAGFSYASSLIKQNTLRVVGKPIVSSAGVASISAVPPEAPYLIAINGERSAHSVLVADRHCHQDTAPHTVLLLRFRRLPGTNFGVVAADIRVFYGPVENPRLYNCSVRTVSRRSLSSCSEARLHNLPLSILASLREMNRQLKLTAVTRSLGQVIDTMITCRTPPGLGANHRFIGTSLLEKFSPIVNLILLSCC